MHLVNSSNGDIKITTLGPSTRQALSKGCAMSEFYGVIQGMPSRAVAEGLRVQGCTLRIRPETRVHAPTAEDGEPDVEIDGAEVHFYTPGDAGAHEVYEVFVACANALDAAEATALVAAAGLNLVSNGLECVETARFAPFTGASGWAGFSG